MTSTLHYKIKIVSRLMKATVSTRGPRYYLDTSAVDIFGKSVPIRHFNKTKDWALVQTAALAINQGFNVGLG